MLSKRSSRSLAIIFATMSDSATGMFGATSCSGAAVSDTSPCHFIHLTVALRSSRTTSAKTSLNFSRPASISYAIMPREYMSARASTSPPSKSSGAMYLVVPRIIDVCPLRPAATPKSIIVGHNPSPTMMLPGFMSRWMIPAL